jgi:ABC-type nitrate/sulfonate/bicarbonate transport system substrate-binding protein
MKKTIPVLIVIALVALGAAIAIHYIKCPSVNEQKVQAVKVSLRLKWLYDPGFAGELVAAKEGIFQKNGLSVEIRPGGFESDPIKLVANGSDTFGVTGADSFLLARANGVPIVAFAAGYIDTAVVYYSHKSASIRSPADWKGKKIGVQAGQDTETIYRVLLSKAGLTSQDVVEIPVKYDFTQFLTGGVDVWPGYAATQSYILNQKGIPYDVIYPSKYGVKYVGTVYFTTEKVMSEHPEWVRGFLKSVIAGWQFTYSTSTESAAISDISSYDPKSLTPDLIKWNLDKQKDSIKPEGREYGEYRLSDFEAMQQILTDQHLLATPLDLSKAISTAYLEDIYNGVH